jgi:hypothetical protein
MLVIATQFGLFASDSRALLQVAGTERFDLAARIQTGNPEVPGSDLGRVTASEFLVFFLSPSM